MNILDIGHLEVLAEMVARAADAKPAVLLLSGGPARCFSAGNDIKDHTPERAPAMLKAFHEALRGLLAIEAVTVADVRGDAYGGGCELVAACDLACATPDAHFGQPEIDVGCFPPAAVSLLPRRIGWSRAVRMIATGQEISATTAVHWGLINEVDANGADGLVRELLAKSPAVLRQTMRALRRARTQPLPDALTDAEQVYGELLAHPDCVEGVEAFLAKRPPRWRDD